MPDVTVTLGADAAEFKQALTEIQKSVDSLVNSTTAKTARIGLAFSGVKDMVSTAFAAIALFKRLLILSRRRRPFSAWNGN